jgi:hypothetical protein
MGRFCSHCGHPLPVAPEAPSDTTASVPPARRGDRAAGSGRSGRAVAPTAARGNPRPAGRRAPSTAARWAFVAAVGVVTGAAALGTLWWLLDRLDRRATQAATAVASVEPAATPSTVAATLAPATSTVVPTTLRGSTLTPTTATPATVAPTVPTTTTVATVATTTVPASSGGDSRRQATAKSTRPSPKPDGASSGGGGTSRHPRYGVTVRGTTLYDDPAGGTVKQQLPANTRLRVVGRSGSMVKVQSVRTGEIAWVRGNDLRPTEAPSD